jgi:hypothetical protein
LRRTPAARRDDFVDTAANDLAWAALLRQAERIAPDFRD